MVNGGDSEFDPRYDPRFQRGWVDGPTDAAAPAEQPPTEPERAAVEADAQAPAATPTDAANGAAAGRRPVGSPGSSPRPPGPTPTPSDPAPSPGAGAEPSPREAAPRAERIITAALTVSLALALLAVLVGAGLISWLLENGNGYAGPATRDTSDMVFAALANGAAPGLVTAGLVGVVVLAVADGLRRSIDPHRTPSESPAPAPLRTLLDRSVLVLAAAAVLGGVAIWHLTGWRVAAEQIWAGIRDDAPAPDEQRLLALYELLPYLLTPAATMLFVAALIGLPVVIGARYAAITRSRRDEG